MIKKPIKQNIKTKKIKRKSNRSEDDIWNLIKIQEKENEKDISSKTENESDEDDTLECIYEKDSIHETNICNLCNSMLYVGEEGFLFCSNSACGKMYKDIIDFGAEWRYYGAEDTNTSDPTRCGMPINPLLVESSFGCKIMCNKRGTHRNKSLFYRGWRNKLREKKPKALKHFYI